MTEISVILATHNRADYLKPCLISLCEQSIDPSRFEICVIANACNDATPQVVTEIALLYPKHRVFLIEEPVAGLSRARNTGIGATKSPFLANIDDDATADPNWLKRFLERFAELPADVAMIGGEVNPVWLTPPPEWLTSWMLGILSAASNLGTEARFLNPQEGIIECNCAYRRAAMESVGNYPLELGRVGNSLLSGEGAIHLLLQHKGWRIYFEPKAIIHHTIHTDRLEPQWFRRRYFWQGISDYLMHRYHSRHGLETVSSLKIDLPLRSEDWSFVSNDNAENLTQNLLQFESLGFALAMSGIIDLS